MRRVVSGATALGRVAVGIILYVSARLVYRVEIHGLEHDDRGPRTFLAMSHKRDMDSIAPVPPIMFHRGWRAVAGDVHFAMRGDAFNPGFLARMVMRPRWFSHLLRPLSVGPILRGLGIQPLQDLRLRPAEEWIRERLRVEGDATVGEALAPALVREMAAATKIPVARIQGLRLSQLLAWRFHEPLQPYWGPEIFMGPARRRAEQRVVWRARRCLADLSAWLDGGGSLYTSPEGRLSADGTLSPIIAGFFRILRAAPRETRVLPIFIIYDFMTDRRPRAFVDLAPPIPDAATLARAELNARLRQAWLRSARFTCSQLASGFLVRAARTASRTFTLDTLAQQVAAQAAELAAGGRQVDPRLLRPDGARRLAMHYLRFAARHGLVRRAGPDTWVAPPSSLAIAVRPGETGYARAPLAYAWNELQEMLALDAPAGMQAAAEARAGE